MKNVLILAALLGLFAGCATQTPDVTTFYDQVTGMRTDLLSDNELEAPGTPREVVWLNASRVFRSGNRADYYLEASYLALSDVGPLEIPAGQTLTLLLDGTAMNLDGTGSSSMRKTFRQDGRELVRETAIYPVTRVQLQKIASAKQVKVRLKGNNGLIEREFSDANSDRFRRFVTRYAL